MGCTFHELLVLGSHMRCPLALILPLPACLPVSTCTQEMEARFPQVPLLPTDPGLRQEALAIIEDLENGHDVGAAGFKFMAGGRV